MAISDVLAEALWEITRYQHQDEEDSERDGMAEEIEAAQTVMANLFLRRMTPYPEEDEKLGRVPPPILMKDVPSCDLVRDYLQRLKAAEAAKAGEAAE